MENYETIYSTWLDGFDSLLNTNTPQSKKKIERVTFQQKELLVNFMSENPEMITHSSTRESERVLWDDLVAKLNNIRPEKTYEYWRMYWNKWINGLESKPDNSLTMLDYKLKKFLKNLGFKSGECERASISSLSEIKKRLIEVKTEKSKNKLELDNLEFKIVKLKNEVYNLKCQVKEKRKLTVSLDKEKNNLTKRMKLAEDKNRSLNDSVDSSIDKSY